MDWHNRLDVIRDKFKFQLHAKGVDSISYLEKNFNVIELWMME